MLLHTATLADWYLPQAYNDSDTRDYHTTKVKTEAAIKLDPSSKTYNTLGICFGYANDFVSAIACFDKSIELKPNQTEAQINRITALIMQGGGARLNELGDPHL